MRPPIPLDEVMTPYHCVAFGAFVEPREDGCWAWVGEIHPRGYGVYRIGRRYALAVHRVQYWIYTKEQPEVVMHTCKLISCVNPRHLYPSTAREMMIEKTRMGRHGRQKLTRGDINRLVELFHNGSKQRDLAKIFGVSQSHISNIINGKSSLWAPEAIDVSKAE